MPETAASALEEREGHVMPPKSYADAVDAGDDHGITPKDRLDQLKETGLPTNGNGTSTNGHTEAQVKAEDNENTEAKVEAKTASNSDSPTAEIQKHANLKHARANAAIANLYGDGVLEREYEDSNGSYLTSTKPPRGYRTALSRDKSQQQPAKTDAASKDLVSGRRAGAGWHNSKIRWAPLNLPLQRRLQTLMVLAHNLSIVSLLSIFLFLCAIPILWPILVPYLVYCLLSGASTSGELSHRSERMRRSSVWSLFASYYPARLHRSVELEPTRKYLFGYHPHGIISYGAWAAFATEALGFAQLFPGITNTLLTLDANFRIPLYRDYALAMGLASVSRESCENLLTHGGPNREGMGRAITIVVGGARESLDATPHTLKLVLKRRKGFVKLALRTGADLVPVLGFGENDVYEQLTAQTHPRVHRVQLVFKKLMGFTVPLFHARGVFNYDVGLLPYRRPLNVVVGRPIRVEQNRRPESEEIDRLHARYVEELLRLWEEWKDEFAPERTEELVMVE